MDGYEDDPFDYNTIEIPTVVGLLRNVLSQYPDNGQILKELVQNAEDAGATVFEAVHDARSTGTNSVTCRTTTGTEVLQKFVESPALFVYNNAEFGREDWHGIRMLSESIKRNDPLKVGQFGLGFKSVFHFTDFVTIISGNTVLFMDPSEPEARMCRNLPLAKLSSYLSEDECLRLWGIYLKREHLRVGHMPGTIFWFPLRRRESKISSKVYEHSDVDRLFNSFSIEAPLCLTFLKSLERICLRKISGQNALADILQVGLCGAGLAEAQERRREFREQLQTCKGFPDEKLTCSYNITVQTFERNQTVKQDFRVLHLLATTSKEKRGTHIPLVGIAAPMPPVRKDSKGQIFCFLPLPSESANNTNLPIQVNGYFLLDQNRRHVKWKTEESSLEYDVMWNENLVKNVIADAYFLLLQNVLQETIAGSCSKDLWYSLLPHTESTTGRWNQMVREIWTKLLQYPILYSEVRNQMMHPGEVISSNNLYSFSYQVANSVQRVLRDLRLPLATIPDNVVTTLSSIGAFPTYVTPELIREYLKQHSFKNGWNQLHLLEYVTSDSQYKDLERIPLLPLQNGIWSKFSERGVHVYICTEEETKALRGVEDRLLSTNLPKVVMVHLQKIAQKGVMQLRSFQPYIHIAELLPISVTYIQCSSLGHQDIELWLQKVWSLLQYTSLQNIEHLSIIPSSWIRYPSSLISLSSAIIVRETESQISEAVVEALRLLGNIVIPKLPTYVRHHELNSYINRADSQGIHQSLQKVLSRPTIHNLINNFNTQVTDEQRQAFSNVISEVYNLKPEVKNLLQKLDLFSAVGKTGITYVSVANVRKVYPVIHDFPVSSPEPLIRSSCSNIHQLALRLDARQLSKEDLCILALQTNYQYSENDIKKLGWYILNDSILRQSKDIRTWLQSVRFIPTSSGKLCMASELYDPLDTDVNALLGETDLTPDKNYREHNSFLKCLGLKKVQDMPIKEMVRVVEGVQNMHICENDRSIKIKTLLKVINQRYDCSQICQEIRNVQCLYGVSSRPTSYPNKLLWATSNGLYSPTRLKSYDFKDVVGSCIPLINCEDIPNVANSFGWNVEPSVSEVINHLTSIVGVCHSVNGIPERAYYEQLKKVYDRLTRFVGSSQEHNLHPLTKLPFVFTGYSFKLPTQVYIPSGKGDLQLLPYLHALPVELCEYKTLFCFLGSFETQSQKLYLQVLKQIQRQHNANGTVDTEHDREIVISVLQKLVKCNSEIDRDQLLLPVETSKDRLELVNISNCAYSDQDCEWLDGEELGVKVVHSSLGNTLAKDLGVEPLNKHLLADEEAVMEWGQHEPLTTRIHNLLHQYRDGVAVFKELVQNADDAGATKISFLYDERQNQDACTKLRTDQFKECQGPALWAYNDAEFTDTDFKNLSKLGEGTKEFMPTKIGKFGLGFCSVYNLTDVPSLVSGSNYVIYDPHGTYLEKNKRGVKYNFSKRMNQIMLKNLHGQFQPFRNVFGCMIQENACFDGTLFRLPFRTTTQASKSKISNQSYSHNEVTDLLNMFRQIVGQILLFTQNIKEVSVFYLDKSSAPQEMELLYKSTKSEQRLMTISGDLCININKGNKQVESVAQLFDNNHQWNGNLFQESNISDIKVVFTKKCQMFNVQEGISTVTWLTSWHSGTGELCRLAENLGGKVLSLGAVAVAVKKENDLWKPRKLKNLPCGFYKESHLHCFLPLPVKTSLPVQINGFFEVAADRTSLVTRTEDDRAISIDNNSVLMKENWNSVLMKDAVNAAYLNLIDTLRLEGLSQDARYFTLWPITNQASDELLVKLARCFYDTIKDKDLKMFRNKNGWHPLSKCHFLASSFYNVHDICSIVFEFMEELLKNKNMQIVKLPEKRDARLEKHISDAVVTEEGFYNQYLFPNFAHRYIVQEKLNKLILHVIDSQKTFLYELKEISCIPTMPHGKLKKPCELIDPKSELAHLFTESDERFPIETFMEGNRGNVLKTLGMRGYDLDDDMILERTKTVDEMSCLSCAVVRSSRILLYFKTNERLTEYVADKIKDIPFIPVMSKPDGWPLKWEADNCQTKQSEPCIAHTNNCINPLSFAAPVTVCSPELMRIAGSTFLIQGQVDENKYRGLQEHVCNVLGVITHQDKLPFVCVVSQLKEYCANCEIVSHVTLKEVCFEIYEYLNNKAKQNLGDLSVLRSEKILLTRKYGFVEPTLFAMDENIDCPSALFSVQREGLHDFKHLMKSLGVKKQFSSRIVFDILTQKKKQLMSTTLTEEEVLLISNLLALLFHVWETNGNEEFSVSDLCLPDSTSILCPVRELCINDGNDLDDSKFKFLHKKVSYSQEMLTWLGIEKKTKRRLMELSHRMEFGQKEPLATRLKNILENYPCDSGIMKELLQNADDAGATEISFIKDFRKLGTEKLFDKKWAPLQGPALCVYNNKCFNEKDLEGIQNLGDSCKRQDATSTGQYGIGFNAVYHLTDAPSFITRGKDVPGYETLCIFDPQCKYDPDATVKSPGVRLTSLPELRERYSDFFEGYLENLLNEEGTVFRLPLRTYEESKEESKIGRVVEVWKLEVLLEQFKEEMKTCLLFLRNVRKISICSVREDGKVSSEYYVKSQIKEEEQVSHMKNIVHERKIKSNSFEEQYLLNMERVTYEMLIKDTNNAEYHWLIVQQFGSQDRDALPELVLNAFTDKLLPQAGVAILLQPKQVLDPNLFKVFCYLPLPVQSGMYFCINGHFALDNSRRNLWTGSVDFKAAWNEWLMREVLASAAAEAIIQFRLHIFPEGCDLTLDQYEKKIKAYYAVLPDSKIAVSDTWRKFVSWFYQHAKKQENPIFDVFITEDDRVVKKCVTGSNTFYSMNSSRESIPKTIKGKLTWHALKKSESGFPMYFDDCEIENSIHGTLKRLGLKLGSYHVYQKLKEAKIQVNNLNDENLLKFLLSWNSDCVDKCQIAFMSEVKNTPFLTVENICKVFKYISSVKDFHCQLNHLPLMVTSDMQLNHFDEQRPVFCTKYGYLLPEFNQEFLHSDLVNVIMELKVLKQDAQVMKCFSLEDLAIKLPKVLDQSWNTQDRLPLGEYNAAHGSLWIKNVWSFIISEVNRKFAFEGERGIDWNEGKKYLLKTLGDWCLYPITFLESRYVTPIKNANMVLNVQNKANVFRELCVPHTLTHIVERNYWGDIFSREIMPKNNFQLATTLEDPAAVLDILYLYRKEMVVNKRMELSILLEYFGSKCEKCNLSCDKLRNLKIFEDSDGHICNLVDKQLLVPHASKVLVESIQKLSSVTNTVILKPATSEKITDLYKYLDPDCIMCELDIFVKFILPNLSWLPASERIKVLSLLRDKLAHTNTKERSDWSPLEVDVVSRLKITPFVLLDGHLVTANHFYDPWHSVFRVMKPRNLLPSEWVSHGWHYFLKLAGMIHELTGEMFVEFAKSLSIKDNDVKKKSKVLVDHLISNYDQLKPKLNSIQDLEFLVPDMDEQLQKISTHLETKSGLIAFSSSAPACHEYLVWTTMNILPCYAEACFKWKELNVCCDVPEEKLFSHIRNITSILPANVNHIDDVMDRIYKHLTSVESSTGFLERFAQENVPVIYLAEKTTPVFVTVNIVVQDLVEEIEPYLYKAPITYGRYFELFQKLGVCKKRKCDHYVEVLKKIHDTSQESEVNPEEARCIKLALKYLADNMTELQEIEAEVLYLPTQDSKLAKSTEMYVSDKSELEEAAGKSFDKALFVGFAALKISGNDLDFVKQLPESLKPTLLSEVVTEEVNEDALEEVESPKVKIVTDLIYSQEFQRGIIRLLNHYKTRSENSLGKEEILEIQKKLESVKVTALREIHITLKLNGEEIGSTVRDYHVKEESVNDGVKIITLYISEDIEDCMMYQGLSSVYQELFSVSDVELANNLMGIFNNMYNPHAICKFLDKKGIREFGEKSTAELYQTKVGSYLQKEYIPLLDNEFCRFHNDEIVAMKKYLSEVDSDDDFIYIIVQVKRQTKSADNVIFDEYEVLTGNEENPLIVIKAYQLYKFIRKNVNDVLTYSLNEEVDEESETEIMKRVRNYVKEMWEIKDESERMHLLRRLYLKWHPDKNMNRTELCTRVMQYIQSLLSRLEQGETIHDNDDPTNSRGVPSDLYSDIFRPPLYLKSSNSSDCTEDLKPSASSYSSRSIRTKMPDRPEGRKWMKQAQHDCDEAHRREGGSACWIMYMCHQAAEKGLKAALYLEDCAEAMNFQSGSRGHNLTAIMSEVHSDDLQPMVQEIEIRVGNANNLRYPTYSAAPCDTYTHDDANYVLPRTKMLIQKISSRF